MALCFVTRALPGDALERLAERHEVEVWPGVDPPGREELLERAARAEGLLAMLTDRVDAELIAAAPRLRAISNYAVGTDNVDLEAANAREIPVGNTPDVLTGATADLAVALMLAAARRLREAESVVREGAWTAWGPELMLGRDLHGATVGIVGPGRIGAAVARRVAGFDCRVLSAGRGEREAFERVLAESDFLSLHSPLTPETLGMIGDSELRAMKPGAILVNTARGALVDHEALALALEQGRLAAAALDVTEPEPLPPGHRLLAAPNLLVVPHIGSATHATRAAMAEIAVDNLIAGLAGEPMPHRVDPRPAEGRA